MKPKKIAGLLIENVLNNKDLIFIFRFCDDIAVSSSDDECPANRAP
jgi:hypothetical protein